MHPVFDLQPQHRAARAVQMSDGTSRTEVFSQLQGKRLLDGGEPEAARIFLENCLALNEVQQPQVVANISGMLAACYTRLMRFDDAESAYERAVRIADEALEPENPVRVAVICSWAALERSRGALERERHLWQLVLPVLQGALGFRGLLRECMRSLDELETLPEKERQLRESFEAARVADQSPEASRDERMASFLAVQDLACKLADLLGGMGRNRERIATLRDGLMMRPEELWRRLTGTNAPFRRRALDEQRCRFNLFLVQSLQNASPQAAQTALETLLWRRGIGLEIYRCASSLVRYNPEIRRTLDALRLNRAKFAADFFAGPSDSELRSQEHSLNIVREPIEQNFEYQTLERELLARLEPQVNRFVSRPADCAELASKISDDGLLIEYWRCTWPRDQHLAASYVALVLPKDRPDQAAIVHLSECAALEDTLLEYLSLLSGRSKTADFGDTKEVRTDPIRARVLGETLRQLLLDPLQTWTARAKHLLLVTDGLLSRLPFSALPLSNGYVMDQWLISYLQTARDLFGGDDAPPTPRSATVISDPAYDWLDSTRKQYPYFERLEYASKEGDAIGEILGVKPLTCKAATKHALTACGGPAILHIATHGMMLPARQSVAEYGPPDPLVWCESGELRFQIPGLAVLTQNLGRLSGRQLPDQALRSVLVLAGINTWLVGGPLPEEVGNGLVTAEDIAGMDLAANQLTVLSACETGLGVIGIGEGVLGLRSGFAIAGAETVVMSLWAVDDASTQDLMCAFYRNLLKGMGRAQALQEAQKAIREKYPEPYYWAPFICQGAVGPLRWGSRAAG